ncbi:YdiU family protein [Sphingomonas sp. KR1UV-12]|uniref:Protein nucleotidyltransferase YdiU n=1 Tax=Sphingomonas aurea TaxID=3063994 RepID=A0ABT9EGZ1_9SPHN|nr:YdiU family protein [Sphingomonas sp. KR1UV-12]MDP1025883.1 YdiU family protein [Sphingomonas sp. KR1UV-12]
MPITPQAYAPARPLLSLGSDFWDPVAPAAFPETRLRFRNDRAAAEVGLADLTDEEWTRHFGRFTPLPDTLPQPLALRYHGHQFRQYNPDIGDGRGFTFAQLRDDQGRLKDLGTKGSGQTPWSRFGDGRLTLKGAVREILATEMLEALNVPTSRTLSVIETGEELHRGDEPSPTRSAVLVRLSHGHIRIGTFQRLAYLRDEANMRRLTAYVLGELYGEPGDDPVRLLTHVVGRTATLAARYMAASFVHGVLNSDNINVTGESFDYGPWRFAPTWDAQFTAAYFDHAGLYAFGRQPEAIGWDVAQLAAALRLIADSDPLIAALEGFAPAFQAALPPAILWRLGRAPVDTATDRATVRTVEATLRNTQAPLDRFFFDAFATDLPPDYGLEWDSVRAALAAHPPRRARDAGYWSASPCSMQIAEVEALWAPIATDDDWAPLEAKIAAIRAMGAALA